MFSDYGRKFDHLAPAFLGVAALSATVPLLLRLVDRRLLASVNLSDGFYEAVLPLVVAGVGVWFWLGRRARILVFRKRASDPETSGSEADSTAYADDRPRDGFLMVGWLVIMAPAVLLVMIVPRALEPLHVVWSVAGIDPAKPARYYKVSEILPDHRVGGAARELERSGNRGQEFRVTFYFVTPLSLPDPDDAAGHPYWFGHEFSRTVSSRHSGKEFEEELDRFFRQSIETIEDYDYDEVWFLEVVQESDQLDGYRRAAMLAGHQSDTPLVVFVADDSEYENRIRGTTMFLALSVILGWSVWFGLLALPGLDSTELERQRTGGPDPHAIPWHESFLAVLFVPRPDHWVLPGLMLVITCIYLLMVFSGVDWLNPMASDLLAWGANRRAEVMGGEWWRLITSIFVHSGAKHLVLNAFGLLLAGLFVESLFGRAMLLALFLLSGVCGSAMSVLWHENATSVGASGGIFGLFGALMALSLRRVVGWREFLWVHLYVGFNLLLGLFPGIDNAAHIGGLACGLVMGLFYRLPPSVLRQLEQPDESRETPAIGETRDEAP